MTWKSAALQTNYYYKNIQIINEDHMGYTAFMLSFFLGGGV